VAPRLGFFLPRAPGLHQVPTLTVLLTTGSCLLSGKTNKYNATGAARLGHYACYSASGSWRGS